MCRLDCKTVGFYSKSVKQLVKRGVRVVRARSARASTPKGRVRREEKNRLSVFLTMGSFRPGGFKKVYELSRQKSVHHSTLFVNLIHSVIDFEGEYRVWLRSDLGFLLLTARFIISSRAKRACITQTSQGGARPA